MLIRIAALKKKHSKSGEETRYQGTLLGKDAEDQTVVIVGGPVSTLQEWGMKVKSSRVVSHPPSTTAPTPATSGISSAPDTPIGVGEEGEEGEGEGEGF